ncbi:hypothetical protein BO79DRAFT_18731 [Aspergillus costaricaensis CBS 115574]|uniref:Uncharacterized protein n=1 Tax=Aspergillus costaricaensis CBS 115574 TaxID=1448317 RepID=A0ACD1ID68_9EURO|nr:hypothetical protein BO79DRAFT_18731 [Aspergillus costaricaensis CBS 115574]RAK88306.1 hypothetical protein BO79DRAFT_18731 [Aspergillus costaricaensis CBS 115574]
MYMTERLFLVSHPSILSYPIFHLVGCLYYQKCLGRWILTFFLFLCYFLPLHPVISPYLPTYLMVGVNNGTSSLLLCFLGSDARESSTTWQFHHP